MTAERGFAVDHSTISRWVIKFTPQMEKAIRRKKRNRTVFLTTLLRWKEGIRVVHAVHDEIVAEVPAKEAESYQKRIESILIKAAKTLCPDVEMRVDSESKLVLKTTFVQVETLPSLHHSSMY